MVFLVSIDVQEYFVEEDVRLKSLHAKYAEKMTEIGYRVISFTRWVQYVLYIFPGLRMFVMPLLLLILS